MPPRGAFGADMTDETAAWVGRAAAVIQRWSVEYGEPVRSAAGDTRALNPVRAYDGALKLQILLHQVQADLRMELGQVSVVFQAGMVFDYFNELRKVIETACSEVFFVDPFLDPKFVSRYLPLLDSGTAVRQLGRERLPALLAAVDAFLQQHNERWFPSFRQLSGQIKVKSGFIDQAASGCDEVGQSPGLGAAPTLYASSGVRSPSDECGRRLL